MPPNLQSAARIGAGALRHGAMGLYVAAKGLNPQGIILVPQHRTQHAITGPGPLCPVAGQALPDHIVAA